MGDTILSEQKNSVEKRDCDDDSKTGGGSKDGHAISRTDGTKYLLDPINSMRTKAGVNTIFWCPIISKTLDERFERVMNNGGRIGYKATMFLVGKGKGPLKNLAKNLLKDKAGFTKKYSKGNAKNTITNSTWRMVGCAY